MPLKVGILGAAGIARKICRALAMTDYAEVVAVGSRSLAKSEAFLEQCGLAGAKAYGSYDEVLDDAQVEAVYIPLPTSMHVEYVRKAAARGMHILLEKPIALTAEDTFAIVACCREAGVQLMDGTMWTHNPRTAQMEAALGDRARVGEVREVSTLFAFMGSKEFMRSDIRTKADCDALGCLGDVGWYCIRAILWAFNYEPPTAVIAHAGPSYNEQGVPMHMGGTLLFSGGRRGNFESGFDRALTQYLEVAGTKGTVRLDDFVIPREEANCSFVATFNHGLRDNDTWDATEREEKIVYLSKPQELYQWEEFAACVARVRSGGAPDERWARLAALTNAVVVAVAESARQGCRELPFEFKF